MPPGDMLVMTLRDFLRDLLVQGAAIREDFRADGRNLVPGFKDRIEAAADERMPELIKHLGPPYKASARWNFIKEFCIIEHIEGDESTLGFFVDNNSPEPGPRALFTFDGESDAGYSEGNAPNTSIEQAIDDHLTREIQKNDTP